MRWINTPIAEDHVYNINNQLGISKIIASLLVHRGLTETQAVNDFINPRLGVLDDPFRVTNLKRAVERLCQAMASNEEILILGDYDVDGITSTVLLVSILNRFSLYPRYLVPRRMEEGYGLSHAAIERALQGGHVNLFIAIDCGTNSNDEVSFLREQGVDVIIIDHHPSKEAIPNDCIIINPHVYDNEAEPWRHLCSVGLVFKLVHGFLKELRNRGHPLASDIELKDYLDLVAMGTIADLVPLCGENRILTKAGLNSLKNSNRLGLNALCEISGMTLGEEVSTVDISYRLSPRINASGRLADATLPIKMLLSDDQKLCQEAAHTLNNFNEERRAIERNIFSEAIELFENTCPEVAGIVLYNDAWHPGVVGIVASRMTQKYYRPCIVLGAEGNLAKGSGRSIKGVNLVEILKKCQELLGQWGGHPMAVGVSLDPSRLMEFQKAFHEAVDDYLKGLRQEPELEIAIWITPESINEQFLDDLNLLHPFGQGNAEPIFGLHNIILKSQPEPFGQNHFRFQLEPNSGMRLFGVAWNQGDKIPPRNKPIDLAAKLAWNFWNGRKSPQLKLVDWRFTEDS